MKWVIYLVLLISFFWSMSLPPSGFFNQSIFDMLVNTYKYQLPSVTWAIALVYLYDHAMAMAKKNSKYMIEFHKALNGEFIVLCALTIFTLLVYILTPQSFGKSNIDISMAGFGFIIMANLSFFRLFNYKIGRRKFPRRFLCFLILISMSLSLYFLYLTFNVAKGLYSFSESLWVQITVFSFSISIYFWARQMCFFMEKGRIEASPVLASLFGRFNPTRNIYAQAELAADHWNKEAEKEQAKNSAELRRKHKKRKKR
ncbi:hypothetical protein HX889_41970 [Pseudomonas reactans]|nr:hypothetical protein [Pseudomonas reactans]